MSFDQVDENNMRDSIEHDKQERAKDTAKKKAERAVK